VGGIELLGTGGHIHYRDGGERIEVRKVKQDPNFPGYRILAEPERLPGDMRRYQWHVVDHLYRHLTKETALNSDGQSAAETLAVTLEIAESGKMGKS